MDRDVNEELHAGHGRGAVAARRRRSWGRPRATLLVLGLAGLGLLLGGCGAAGGRAVADVQPGRLHHRPLLDAAGDGSLGQPPVMPTAVPGARLVIKCAGADASPGRDWRTARST